MSGRSLGPSPLPGSLPGSLAGSLPYLVPGFPGFPGFPAGLAGLGGGLGPAVDRDAASRMLFKGNSSRLELLIEKIQANKENHHVSEQDIKGMRGWWCVLRSTPAAPPRGPAVLSLRRSGPQGAVGD